MTLRSQQARRAAPEADALRLGIGWTDEDLTKPYVLVESVAGDSHPGSVHLARLADRVADGTRTGSATARYTCTDMCDGIAQGTDAMDYSLPSRDLITAAVEMHANAGYYDAVALISSCDKAVPAHLMAAARLDLPTMHLPGGVMPPGRDDVTIDQVGTLAARLRRGELSATEYQAWVREAAPSCGSCAFMGTALTSQVMAEVLGLALPHTATMPATGAFADDIAERTGRQLLQRIATGLTARDLLTPAAIRNAMVVHAAIGGSTNFVIHLAAICAEAGVDFDVTQWQRISDNTPYLTDIRPAGRYPANLFWHAGGTPALIGELARQPGSLLELDAPCGEDVSWAEFLDREGDEPFGPGAEELRRRRIERSAIIRGVDDPVQPRGALAFLTGNLAPGGAVVKRTAVHPDARKITGRARVFDNQEDALDAITARSIKPGDVLVIRGEGPRATGMPEQYYVTSAIAADDELVRSVALITDGRFSGASLGPCIGHVSPEAALGGPLSHVREGDRIAVDIEARTVDLLDAEHHDQDGDAVRAGTELLRRRAAEQQTQPVALRPGYLGIYQSLADTAMAGARMRPAES